MRYQRLSQSFLLCLLLLEPAFHCGASGAPSSRVTITTGFPGGNIVLERIDVDDVSVHQDLRDTKSDWFSWQQATPAP